MWKKISERHTNTVIRMRKKCKFYFVCRHTSPIFELEETQKLNIFHAKLAPYFHHMVVTFSIENSLQMINANDIQSYLYAKRENFYVSLLWLTMDKVNDVPVSKIQHFLFVIVLFQTDFFHIFSYETMCLAFSIFVIAVVLLI